MRFLIMSMLAVFTISVLGCSPPAPDESKFIGAVAVQASIASMNDGSVVPLPDPSPDNKTVCLECNGKGRVKTGDGISWTECDECEGTGYSSGIIQIDEFSPINNEISQAYYPNEVGPVKDAKIIFASLNENETQQPSFDEASLPPNVVPYIPNDLLPEGLESSEICVSGSCGPTASVSTSRAYSTAPVYRGQVVRRLFARQPVRNTIKRLGKGIRRTGKGVRRIGRGACGALGCG